MKSSRYGVYMSSICLSATFFSSTFFLSAIVTFDTDSCSVGSISWTVIIVTCWFIYAFSSVQHFIKRIWLGNFRFKLFTCFWLHLCKIQNPSIIVNDYEMVGLITYPSEILALRRSLLFSTIFMFRYLSFYHSMYSQIVFTEHGIIPLI